MSRTPYQHIDQLFVAGVWKTGEGEVIENLNPYTGKSFMKIHAATREDVSLACEKAREAQQEWARQPPSARAAVMQKAAGILDERKDEIMRWITQEGGGTRIKAATECKLVNSVLMEAAVLPFMLEGKIMPEDIPGKESRVYRQPIGVVGLISPWNFPFQLTMRTLAPALALGNAVVVKPASDTIITGGLFAARLFEEAGLPQGLLSVLPGSGSEIGSALMEHPIPGVISFTGSTPVGRTVAKTALDSKIIKNLELELGGNGPLVVLEDADLEQAVDAAVWSKFMHCGQICMATNRVIVVEPVYDDFVKLFTAKVKSLKVGDPSDPDTFIGPIINQKQVDSIMEMIGKAKEEGGRCVLEGKPDGLIIPPHIFIDLAPDSILLNQEIFGPVAPVQKATDEDEALMFANNTEYGLSSAVFTRDYSRGLQFASRIEAGMTHINDQPVNDSPFSAFGGEKNSGLGRFNGRWAIDAFTTDHWISVQHTPRKFPYRMSDLESV